MRKGAIAEAIFVLEALSRTLGHRQIEPNQFLIHTDQCSKWCAMAYRQPSYEKKISCCMSAMSGCLDNAVVERFFSTLND